MLIVLQYFGLKLIENEPIVPFFLQEDAVSVLKCCAFVNTSMEISAD